MNELPLSWQGEANLDALEDFLQDNWDARYSLYDDGSNESAQQFLNLNYRNGIKTQNYIGTIVFRGESLDIFPKVYQSNADFSVNNLLTDLLIWLHYCDSANYPFISMPSEFDNLNNFYDIFATIYLNYVMEMLKQHLFLCYENVRETGAAVKGKIDFADYVQKKFSSGNKHLMDYEYSAFIFDNKINQIIKYTCSMISRRTKSAKNQELLRSIMHYFDEVSDKLCTPADCDSSISLVSRGGYKIILQLSKMFLLNKTVSGLQGQLDSFCFLFPAELLFEGFIGGFVKEIYGDDNVLLQPRDHYFAKAFLNDKSLGSAFRLQEDIIIDCGEGTTTVLDTKYKAINPLSSILRNKKLNILDSDIRQIAIYALNNNAPNGYLIYPLYRNEKPDVDKVYYEITEPQNDYCFKTNIHIIRVPFTFSEDYYGRMSLLRQMIKGIMFDADPFVFT